MQKPKVQTAAYAVSKMNAHIEVTAYELRVGKETEKVFSEEFFSWMCGKCLGQYWCTKLYGSQVYFQSYTACRVHWVQWQMFKWFCHLPPNRIILHRILREEYSHMYSEVFTKCYWAYVAVGALYIPGFVLAIGRKCCSIRFGSGLYSAHFEAARHSQWIFWNWLGWL